MTEIGNDVELLAIALTPDVITAGVVADRMRRDAEELRVRAISPADDEPGTDYYLPDEPPHAH